VILLIELLLVYGLLFFRLHLLVFLSTLAPLAGDNRLFVVGCVAILTNVIIRVDPGFLLLGNRLGHGGLLDKWHFGVELAALHVSVVGFALLATLARTRLLLGADEDFIQWLRLKIKDVVKKTVSGNHHLQTTGVEGVWWVHEGAQ
jgi:hypothetical protein